MTKMTAKKSLKMRTEQNSPCRNNFGRVFCFIKTVIFKLNVESIRRTAKDRFRLKTSFWRWIQNIIFYLLPQALKKIFQFFLL